MRKLFHILFSIYVWTICFAWMAVVYLFTFLLLPLFPYKKTYPWLSGPGFSLCLRLIFCPVKVIYDPKFDKNRRSVFCQNHVNLLDAFIATRVIPHAFCGLMHRWQFNIPIYGWMMRTTKGIPVDPKKIKDMLPSMTLAAQKRKQDEFSILTFPEGGRTRDGAVHHFKRGVFLMARDANYPVVPTAVHGNFFINQKGSRLFRPGKIKVYVGPQIETQGLSDDEISVLAHRCEDFVRNKVRELAV